LKNDKRQYIKKENQELIYLKWLDAHSDGGWHSPEEVDNFLNKDDCICENVGWILYEDDKVITLCARRIAWKEVATEKDHIFGMLQKIPIAWIVERKILIKPKKYKGK
jgi:hypothetical protein